MRQHFWVKSRSTGWGSARCIDRPTEHTTSQLALAWLLARYERMLLIPGTSSMAHLEENMAAIEIELDDADLAALDRVGQRGFDAG
jgi:aryl-alcohol dehydrogenase-like predicted oxidoreductase